MALYCKPTKKTDKHHRKIPQVYDAGIIVSGTTYETWHLLAPGAISAYADRISASFVLLCRLILVLADSSTQHL